MKKFLSLVLALVMTMSLVTVSAGAKDFTDASDVNYKEAIDVMSTIKVISGYDDGSINPQGSLTRGAAAKIICNLVLGPTDAAALKVTDAPYKDVPANSTFAGYISYCKSAGYVSGYADGTFKPGAPLTGYAFMKMLLGTLGLDKNIEGYEGTNWSVNVAKRALQLDLASGLKGDFNGTKAINREEAMLFAFNTLNTKVFEYSDKGTNITVGDMTVNTGAKAALQKVGGNAGAADSDELYKVLFGSDLQKITHEDELKHPATIWKYKNKEIGTYAKEAKLTYTTKVSYKDVYKALDLAAGNSFNYYVDGVKVVGDTIVFANDADTSINYSGRGVKTEVYYKADSQALVVVTQSAIAKVADIRLNADEERVALINNIEYKTEDFAKGDYVVYTSDGTEILSAYKVEKQTGTITKKVGSDTFTIDGVEYKTNQSQGLSITGNVKDTVEFYLDEYGYIMKMSVKSSTASVDNLAFVVDGGNVKGTGWVKMYKANGTAAEVVDITKAEGLNYADKLVTYKMDGAKYALETTGNYYNFTLAGDNYTFTKGKAFISNAGTPNVGNSDIDVKLDAKTTFMVIDSKGDMTTYVGIKNTPTLTSFSKFAIQQKDGVATLVVVFEPATVSANSSDLTFVVYNKDAAVVDLGDGKTYTTYKTMKKGVEGTLDFDSFAPSAFDATFDNYLMVLNSYNVNSDGYVTTVTLATGSQVVRATQVSEPANDVISLDSVAYALADNVAVYTVAKNGTIATAELDDIIETDSNNVGVHYNQIVASFNNDTEVDQIFLCTVR